MKTTYIDFALGRKISQTLGKLSSTYGMEAPTIETGEIVFISQNEGGPRPGMYGIWEGVWQRHYTINLIDIHSMNVNEIGEFSVGYKLVQGSQTLETSWSEKYRVEVDEKNVTISIFGGDRRKREIIFSFQPEPPNTV